MIVEFIRNFWFHSNNYLMLLIKSRECDSVMSKFKIENNSLFQLMILII